MSNSSDITVCTATIPPRQRLLRMAINSVLMQTLQPDAIIVQYDHDHAGASITKNKALHKVTTKWTAWLDDDDQFLPQHLEVLKRTADESGADVVYSWPIVQGAADPVPQYFGVPFDPDALRAGPFVHTTCLFNASMARQVGGFHHAEKLPYDDWGLWLSMLEAGAKFVHVPQQTWIWKIEGQNTSGDPARW